MFNFTRWSLFEFTTNLDQLKLKLNLIVILRYFSPFTNSQKGINKGRKGRGSIFVWATGNGGRFSDYCSCDGYINSPFTISIGAVDNCGRKPWYSEPCPGTFAVTYSSGEPSGNRDKQIATTDLKGLCTKTHTGTSAAAPLAAGMFLFQDCTFVERFSFHFYL